MVREPEKLMQREGTRRSDYALGRSLRQFWSVMQEMSRMLEAAHGADARPGVQHRDGTRPWEPLVTEMPAGNDLIMYFELPGVEREDVDLSLYGRSLVVSGLRKEIPSFENVTVEDIVSGGFEAGPVQRSPFKRTVELPKPVEEEDVEAAFGAGLLQVRITDIAEGRLRHIRVRGGRRHRR